MPSPKKRDTRNRIAKGRQYNENRSRALAPLLVCPVCHGRVTPESVGCDELVYVPEFRCNCGVKFAIMNAGLIDGGIVQDGDKVPSPVIKTAAEWDKELGTRIIDWDGFERRDPSVKMTKEEFQRRSIHATQLFTRLPTVKAMPPARMTFDEWNDCIICERYSRDCPECKSEALMVVCNGSNYRLECQACFQCFGHDGPARKIRSVKSSVGLNEVTYTESVVPPKYRLILTERHQKLGFIDIYDILELTGVADKELDHAAKKILCSGRRGKGDKRQDVTEAIVALQRFLERHPQETLPQT
jgi:hypothetical protein